MSEKLLRVAENALRGFVEDLIQSEEGPSKDDLNYIEAERNRIRQLRLNLETA